MGGGTRATATVASFLDVLILLSLTTMSTAILDPLDFLALQSIRKSLEDMPGSTFFSSWDFTSDPCTFSGVLCDTEAQPNKVVALNLGDARAGSPGLIGRLDPSIGRLSSLAELTVVPGRVFGTIPDSIGQCKQLQFLGISRNYLSGPIPDALAGLSRLQTLDLSYNLLSGAIPAGLGSLPLLANLIFSRNKLSGRIPPISSPALTRLDLRRNLLTGPLPQRLPPSITYLSLSWNNLSGNVDRVLSRLQRLNYLDLSMNRFTGSIPAAMFGFPITSLQLQRNLFTGEVAPLDQVTIPTVDLSYNLFTGHISPLFSSVQNLYLNNNRFTGQVPGSFVDRLLSSGIQILYLQHNYLTGIELNPTSAIPLTTSLCIQYNCMIPPSQATCPLKAGTQKTRPTSQCIRLRG
ncbi:LRR receptor-like serine/threonine-protein kinase ERECTA [Nymphaea colorata]|uniref:LRR receptor-like serine/threonine-protein kinase ERECTA n=1 Tax=Nymphaea colorata TaxID=210225 RepID=UPI00129E2C6F|nr:LRR receptor-like serine/threonine-protein kinase ERECTA [Nymphaea colorata]